MPIPSSDSSVAVAWRPSGSCSTVSTSARWRSRCCTPSSLLRSAPIDSSERSRLPRGCSIRTSSRYTTREMRTGCSGSPCPSWRARRCARASSAKGSCRWMRRFASRARHRRRCSTRTIMVSCIATSSRKICCSPQTATRSSPISGLRRRSVAMPSPEGDDGSPRPEWWSARRST